MILEEEIKGKVKEVLEKLALLERGAFCEGSKDRKNGFYERDLETSLGTIEGLSVPRTREKGFCPFFLKSYKRILYTLGELVIVMYQGGRLFCSGFNSNSGKPFGRKVISRMGFSNHQYGN